MIWWATLFVVAVTVADVVDGKQLATKSVADGMLIGNRWSALA